MLIFGPPAVGKMSVGRHLAELSGLKLLHNHHTIELVLNFFPFGSEEFGRLSNSFRFQIFKEVAQSNLKGLIFTYVWGIGLDESYVESIFQIFEQVNAQIYAVELESDLDKLIERNKTEERLAEKPSKRDIEESEKRLLEMVKKYKLNTTDQDEIKLLKNLGSNYLKINSNQLSAIEVAQIIQQRFDL